MRVVASLLAAISLVLCVWIALCGVFARTYFRPLADRPDYEPTQWRVAADCGEQLYRDVGAPAVVGLLLHGAFCVWVAIAPRASSPSGRDPLA